jgi:hypothetical protein
MRQFEIQQAKNCGIEWRERDPDAQDGLVNRYPRYEQQATNPGTPTQSIFPRAFQAHQEDGINLWVNNGQ